MNKKTIKSVVDLSTRIEKDNKALGRELPTGAYVTPDEQIFYRTAQGLQFARGHAGAGIIAELDGRGEIITKDVDSERKELLNTLSENPDLIGDRKAEDFAQMNVEDLRALVSPESEEDDEEVIDLTKKKVGELRELLLTLDPTIDGSKMKKDELMDKIESANTLSEYDEAALVALIRACDTKAEEPLFDGIEDEKAASLGLEDLKALALYVRDGVTVDSTSEALDRVAMLSVDGDG